MDPSLQLRSYPVPRNLFAHPEVGKHKESPFVTSRKSIFNSVVLQTICNFRNLFLKNEQKDSPSYWPKRGVSIASGLFSIGASLFFGSIEVVARVAIGVITSTMLTLSSKSRVYRFVSDLGFEGAKTTFYSLLHGVKTGFQAMSSNYHPYAIESYRESKREDGQCSRLFKSEVRQNLIQFYNR